MFAKIITTVAALLHGLSLASVGEAAVLVGFVVALTSAFLMAIFGRREAAQARAAAEAMIAHLVRVERLYLATLRRLHEHENGPLHDGRVRAKLAKQERRQFADSIRKSG